MKRKKSPLLLVFLACCFIVQGALQRLVIFDQWARDFNPGKGKVYTGAMSPDQILAVLAGFREITAGILWVKADSFFDQGNYDAILPLIRLVTLLDPNEIDVYATGMWHIGYNFTDEEQRSDRRYLPSALALGKEGCQQNPDTYELFFEEGWLWYHKIDDDYDQAVKWFLKAQEHPDMLPARKNLLGMAYQRTGNIDMAAKAYYDLYDSAQKKYESESEFGNHQNRDTLESNLDNTLVRMTQRGYIAETEKRPLTGYDPDPPFDVGFSVKATVVEPNIVRFEGTWNVLPVGTRIRVVLRDLDYPGAKLAELNWDANDSVSLDPPKDRTFMQEQLFVRNRRFNKKVDMSKDPTMYPFIGDKYVLEFYYNPRSAPPHIQDKFSWSGEGMTDKNFLRTDVRPGNQRVIFASLPITRDMIRRYGDWVDKTPVVKTDNYKESAPDAGREDDAIIKIPSIRSGTVGGATTPAIPDQPLPGGHPIKSFQAPVGSKSGGVVKD